MALLKRLVLRTVKVAVVLFVLLWVFTLYMRYPNPVASVRLGLASPSGTVKLMPANTIEATAPVALTGIALPLQSLPPLPPASAQPAAVGTSAGSKDYEQFLTETKTNAFLVMRNGRLLWEWYADGVTRDTLLPSYSVAKTVVGILAGQAIARGQLRENDRFVALFPELKSGTAFDKVTLGQLLDMKGGVDVIDDYPSGPSGWLKPVAQMYATTDLMHFLKGHHGVLYEPGSKAEYRSIDALLAGMMVRKATGKTLAALMEADVFPQIGAEHAASWSADRKGGIERSFCCLNMTARDYAKIGQLFNTKGVGPKGRVIDPAWFTRMTVPAVSSFGENNWGYGAFTWHPQADAVFMTGLNGQYVLAVPSTQTVVVKLSDDTIGGVTAQTYAAMRQIADTAGFD